MEAKEIVLQTLKQSDKALKAGEIASIAGIEKADVDKAIKTLKKEEMIISPKVCYYQVK